MLSRLHDVEAEYHALAWRMFETLDRVYDNAHARNGFGWRPETDFTTAFARPRTGRDPFGPLMGLIGSKGYHATVFDDGPYPVE